MPKRIIEKIRHHFSEVLKIKKSPHEIALGFAIGTLIGILPTPGISIPIALLVILIFERVSKISLFGAIVLWNPLLTFPLYPLSYELGDKLLADIPSAPVGIFANVYNISTRFLVGNIIIALTISIACYAFVWLLAQMYQSRKKRKGTARSNQ